MNIDWAPELLSHADRIASKYPQIKSDVLALKAELESGRPRRRQIPGVEITTGFRWQPNRSSYNTKAVSEYQLIVVHWRPGEYYIADICEGDDCEDYSSTEMRKVFRRLRVEGLRSRP